MTRADVDVSIPKIMTSGLAYIEQSIDSQRREEVLFYMARVKQIRVIDRESATAFESEVNEAMRCLSEKSPDLTVSMESDRFRAVITFETVIEETEPRRSMADSYHEDGIRFVCEQCPHFEERGPRVRWGRCRYAVGSITHRDSECCEYFYKSLAQGEVDVLEGGPR